MNLRLAPKFDWSINFGHVLTIASIVIGVVSGLITFMVSFSNLSTRLSAVEDKVSVTSTLPAQVITNTINLNQQKEILAKLTLSIEQTTGVLQAIQITLATMQARDDAERAGRVDGKP